MSLINDTLKNISLKELCILIILVYALFYILDLVNILSFNSTFFYVLIIFYFIFKLRNSFLDFKKEFLKVFSKDIFRYILIVVVLNIFLSYGMLYLSDFILKVFPNLNLLVGFHLSSLDLNNSLIYAGSLIVTVVISPISEELIFRGVLLNRLRLFCPTTFAIMGSSLLFAALHPYGSIISAFIFAVCMAILYLKTENIMVTLFAHFLNNLLAESIVIVDSHNLLFSNGLIISLVSILSVISAVLIMSSIIKELNNIKY